MWDATLNQAKQGKIPEMAAELWGADPTSVSLVHSGNHLVFRMKCHSKTRYLKITHPLKKSRKELAAAIDYQRYVFETGAPVCQPVKSVRGCDVEEISHWDNTFLVYANDEVQGDAIHFEHREKCVYESWGKSLAHLHRAAKNYHPDKQHQFLYWHDLWEEVGRFAASENEIIQQEYAAIDEWLGHLSKDQHDFGLTHGNHCAGKAFYDGREANIITSDEPVYHWYFADMARPFLDLCPEKFDQWKEKAVWFLDGYYTILPFADDKMHYLPWFVRMKNIDVYLWMKKLPEAGNHGFRNVRLAELEAKIQKPLQTWDL